MSASLQITLQNDQDFRIWMCGPYVVNSFVFSLPPLSRLLLIPAKTSTLALNLFKKKKKKKDSGH